MATVNIHDRVLPGKSKTEVFAGITAAADVASNYRVTAPSSSTLVLAWRRTPGWAILLALLGLIFLLLGLLFLLVKTTDLITVNAEDTEAGVKVSVVGTGSDDVVSFLGTFLAA